MADVAEGPGRSPVGSITRSRTVSPVTFGWSRPSDPDGITLVPYARMAEMDLKGVHVLVVEDTDDSRKLLRHIL